MRRTISHTPNPISNTGQPNSKARPENKSNCPIRNSNPSAIRITAPIGSLRRQCIGGTGGTGALVERRARPRRSPALDTPPILDKVFANAATGMPIRRLIRRLIRSLIRPPGLLVGPGPVPGCAGPGGARSAAACPVKTSCSLRSVPADRAAAGRRAAPSPRDRPRTTW